ncbi:MAG: alpha/beta hydrolase, partial [Gammaproteobacteria bacterium]|nr:alpha/beta hydrolase [Gammaproteobacteria bacterium]
MPLLQLMRHPIAKHSDRLARLACLHLVFLTASGWAADCSIDSTDIDRGQRKPFFICGDSVTPDYELTGLAAANVTLSYHQYLKRCAVDDNRRGIFFWLQAEADAKTMRLAVRNAQGDSLCDSITLTVPERKTVGLARLTAATQSNSNIHLLTLEAAQGQNFSAACADGISFPGWGRQPSRWPKLRLLSDGEMDEVPPDLRRQPAPLNCTGEMISALVRIAGQQREAAKIVIAAAQLASGETVEGVAYARLPDPAWANSMPDEDGKFIDVDGIRTHYWEKGSGPALLLIHGGQPTGKDGGALTWLRNFDGLAERFHVYAIDRLGQGLTDNPQSRDDYEHYYERVAEHVWGFINAVGIDKVALVGHSQGGWPVSRLALDHPDRVSCLVNVDGVLAPGSDLNLHTSRFYLHTIQFHPPGGATFESMKRTREFQSHTLNNIADFAVRRGYDLAQLPKLEEATVMMKELRMNPRHPAAQALFEQARQDIAAGMLKVPSLVIWGYNDPSSPYPGGLALFELINKATPISQLHVFANSGHESHIEYPEQFN